MSNDEAKRREIHYSGRVQGVGFRVRTKSVAASYDVTGFVSNLPDGRVRVLVEGSAAELDRFQNALEASMRGNIEQVTVHELPASGEISNFSIRT